jgi:hypothetical protein
MLSLFSLFAIHFSLPVVVLTEANGLPSHGASRHFYGVFATQIFRDLLRLVCL